MIKIDQLLKNPADIPNQGVSYEQPLDLLASCHEKIVNFSSLLVKLSTKLKQDGWSEELITSADNICRYFNVAGPEHHLDEEQHLFPAIIALDPELQSDEIRNVIELINRMIKEHVESDALWDTINDMLKNKTEDYEQLETLSTQFEKIIHKHAELENTIIFPYAKAHINDTDLKEVGLGIAKRRGLLKQTAP